VFGHGLSSEDELLNFFLGAATCLAAAAFFAVSFGIPSATMALTTLYALSGGACAAAYVPQLISSWRDGSGAESTSLSAYALWTASSTIGLLYSILVNGDVWFVLYESASTAGCSGVLIVTAWRRFGAKKKEKAPVD
jgi:hypothetical protein